MHNFKSLEVHVHKTQRLRGENNKKIITENFSELRNESNIFSADPGINQKRTENCINVLCTLLQKFSILFSVDTSIN